MAIGSSQPNPRQTRDLEQDQRANTDGVFQCSLPHRKNIKPQQRLKHMSVYVEIPMRRCVEPVASIYVMHRWTGCRQNR
jgi:hypothetical protein